MKILVTGANGFLGKYICKRLLKEGHEVAGLVQSMPVSTNMQMKYFIDQLPNLSVKSITDWSPDAIIHGAFETNITNIKKAYETNIVGSKKVLQLAHDINAYFLFISSMASHEKALSIYGKHKFMVESIIDLSRDGIIGPGLIIGEGGVFLRAIEIISNTPFIPLFYGGKQKIQTVNIEDVASGIIEMIKVRFTGKLMIGENSAISLRDFYGLIAKSLNKKPLYIWVPGNIVLFILKLIEKLNLGFPLSSDNLYGIKKLKVFLIDDDLEKLGITPLSTQESINKFPWEKYLIN